MSAKIILAWLLKMKNPAILTSALYVLSFFLLLPYLIQWQLPVSNTLLVMLGMLLAVVLVTVLLNWAYVATMIFPIAAALFFFFLGWILYIIAPGIDALAQVVLVFLNGTIANLGAGGATQNITAFAKDATTIVNHVGQFMITIGAAIYIHAKTLVGKINYVAVGAFVTVFALLGVALGFTGLSGVAIFLVIWLMFYMRMQGSTSDQTIADMRVLFKIVATIVVLIGSGMIHFSTSFFSAMQNGLGASFGGVSSSGSGGDTFSEIWRYFWTVALLVETWKPSLLWKLVPVKYTSAIKTLLEMR